MNSWNPPWSPNTRTFETAKGSVYAVLGTRTQRMKAQRIEHGKDAGLKSASLRTVYIDPDQAKEFGAAQGLSPVEHFVVDVDDQLKRVRLLYMAYGKWKVGVKWTPFQIAPEMGLAPLELFDEVRAEGKIGYTNWHPGNKIVRIG